MKQPTVDHITHLQAYPTNEKDLILFNSVSNIMLFGFLLSFQYASPLVNFVLFGLLIIQSFHKLVGSVFGKYFSIG